MIKLSLEEKELISKGINEAYNKRDSILNDLETGQFKIRIKQLDDKSHYINLCSFVIASIKNPLKEEEYIDLIVNYSNYSKKAVTELIKQKKDLIKYNLEEKERKTEEKQQQSLYNNLHKGDVFQLLVKGDKDQATEIIVEVIKKKYYLYTLRDDEKPEVWIYNKGIYIPEGKTFIKEFLREYLGLVYTSNLANKVIDKIEADTYIDNEEFFKEEEKSLIAVNNGILNIYTKELISFSPNYKFFNKLPINYIKNQDCPAIKKHFNDVLKDKSDVPIIQELAGYLLIRDYKHEKAFMLTGTGRNGKGKTLELFKRFLGANNCCNIPLVRFEKDNYALSGLHTKLANLGADISSTSLKETGNFKSLTGRDLISAPRKFKKDIIFTNYAKLIFCANELPKTTDKTIAFFNRWIMIDFPFTFLQGEEYEERKNEIYIKKADPNHVEKLSTEEELSGFLNWALEGLERLEQNKCFSYSKTTEQVKNSWIRKSDSFSAFYMDNLKEDWDSTILKSELKKEYSKYCRLHKLKSVSDKDIKNVLMTDYGCSEERLSNDEGGRVWYWVGISFDKGVKEDTPNLTPIEKTNSCLVSNKVVKFDTLDKLEENIEIIEENVE